MRGRFFEALGVLWITGCALVVLTPAIGWGLGEWRDRHPQPRPAAVAQPRTFGGYRCTQDCSGHEAGYEWAQDKGIMDEGECPDRSPSFQEGCLAYIEAERDLQSAFVSGP